jgi:hypothetical protein
MRRRVLVRLPAPLRYPIWQLMIRVVTDSSFDDFFERLSNQDVVYPIALHVFVPSFVASLFPFVTVIDIINLMSSNNSRSEKIC